MASGTKVGTAYVTITPKLDKSAKSSVENQMRSIGDKASSKAGTQAGKNLGGGLTKGLAGVAGAIGGIISSVVGPVVSAISDSMDAAINRVDTLNNFPKIMESIGYSADDAKTQINRIAESLDGLPTSTNALVDMVQKIAPLTGSLSEATDISLAFNNALLAGGKSTEVQANALEQYSQMLAAGKVDMQAWNSMVSAMPGQLDQLAKSLLGAGANQKDLYNAMKDGSVTFDDFNGALLRLNKDGIDGLANFEDQARAATGGIGTAMENMGNRAAAAIAMVLDAVGQENIAGVINGISSSFKNAGLAGKGFVESFKANFAGQDYSERLRPFAERAKEMNDGFIAAASAIGDRLGKVTSDVLPGAIDCMNGFIEVSDSAGQVVRDLATALGESLYSNLNDIYTAITGEQLPSWDDMVNLWTEKIIPTIQNELLSALDDLRSRLDMIHDILTGDWEGAWEKALTFEGGEELYNNLKGIDESLQGIRDSVDGLGQFFADNFQPLIDKVSEFRSGEGPEFERLMGAIGKAMDGVWIAAVRIKIAVRDAVKSIARALKPIIDVIQPVIDKVVELLGKLEEARTRGLGTLFGEAGEGGSDGFTIAIEAISRLIELTPQAAEGLASFIEGVSLGFQGISETVNGVVLGVVGFIETVAGIPGRIATYFGEVKANIETPINEAKTNIETTFNEMVTNTQGIPDRIIGVFSGLGSKISEAVGSIDFPTPHITWDTVDILGQSFNLPKIEFYARGGYLPNMSLLGVSEEVGEGIVPLEGRHMYPLADAMAERLGGNGTTNVYIDGNLTRISRIAEETFDQFMDELARYGTMQGARA